MRTPRWIAALLLTVLLWLPQVSAAEAFNFEGNWLVEWQGAHEGKYVSAVVTIQRPRDRICEPDANGDCLFRPVVAGDYEISAVYSDDGKKYWRYSL